VLDAAALGLQRDGSGFQQHAAGDCQDRLRKEEIQNSINVEARAPSCTGDPSLERGDTLQRMSEVFDECGRGLAAVLASELACRGHRCRIPCGK
jgi:hypothetical protein